MNVKEDAMTAKRQITVGEYRTGPLEREYVNDVLNTGRLSYGPWSRRFEKQWAEAHGCKHAVFCNSGTSALHIAVAALKEKYGWRDGDEILVPSVTFVATVNVVIHNNLKPVFVDVDPDTYNIDPLLISDAVTARSRGIIPVHLCGLPSNMPEIAEIAKLHNLKMIEDSCETAFADVDGRPVGSWGEIGCFSTYMAHYITTGVGGFATTNDPELAVTLRSLMNHGRDSIYLNIDDDNGKTAGEMKEVIARRFSFDKLGHSFRCTEFEAAIGCAQMERKESIVAARVGTAMHYTRALSSLRDVMQLPTGDDHVYMLYPIVLDKKVDKVALVNFLEENGIETRDLLPLLDQPVYRNMFGRQLSKYPVAKRLDKFGFYIGCHQYLTPDDVEYVADKFHEFFNRKRT